MLKRVLLGCALVVAAVVAVAGQQIINAPNVPAFISSSGSGGGVGTSSTTQMLYNSAGAVAGDSRVTLDTSDGSATAQYWKANVALAAGSPIRFYIDGTVADRVEMRRSDNSAGVTLQVNPIGTISSGFGTSPALTASSTDLEGSINVGTGGTATTGVINFGATWANAPHCNAVVETSTGANTRTMGVTTSTTQMTITASAAWAASAIVNWICLGNR